MDYVLQIPVRDTNALSDNFVSLTNNDVQFATATQSALVISVRCVAVMAEHTVTSV
jgi:hypothetical protein